MAGDRSRESVARLAIFSHSQNNKASSQSQPVHRLKNYPTYKHKQATITARRDFGSPSTLFTKPQLLLDMMPNCSKRLLATLLASSSIPLTSLLISSSILSSQLTFAEDTTDSSDGSCTSTQAQPADASAEDEEDEEDNQLLETEEGFLHVVPWEGDPTDKPIWWTYSYGQLFDYFACADILPGYATIFQEGEYIIKVENHTLDPFQIQNLTGMWDEMVTKYKAEVNLSPKGSSENVMVVPSEIGDAGSDKGRGVFVTEKVPKGSLVINTDSDSIGIFKDGHTWRKYVATLPAYTACNVIEWSWIQDFALDDKNDVRNGLTIMTAWDESNLLNNADWEDSEEDPNVRCGTPPKGWPEEEGNDQWGPCLFHYYAIQDIEAGDEILMAYSEFENFSRDWPRIGLPVDEGLSEPMVEENPEAPKISPPESK